MTKDIAIIGLACRFPGATSADEFWVNLAAGVNSITEIPRDRWDHEIYVDQTASKWGGFINGLAEFDARFFSISPREALSMDPQQRLLLEVAWHCIEHSGVAPVRLQQQRTGVYMGAMTLDYLQTATAPGIEVDGFACLGGYSCILSNRISHAFRLSGPSITLDTACSSSLVAIHLARQALLAGDCDIAFAGGVSLNHKPWKHLSFSRARMLSPTGQCRTFDGSADGYVPGEGCGVLLLQPLEQALAENNRILGVLKGSAVNHSAVGESLTAPSVDRQTALLMSAYQNAAVDPATVTYLEAHGTGTSLGDPIEMEALTRVFASHSDRSGYCKVGSVKTNIGHLEAAAGVAGMVKVLLLLQAKAIPPSLNLTTPNPLINFDSSPFVPALALEPWTPAAEGLPLRAGISSFGFGGSNAHVILEAPPASEAAPASQTPRQSSAVLPFLLSAKSVSSLEQLVTHWQEAVDRLADDCELEAVCANLALSKESFPWRFGFTAVSWAEVKLALAQFQRPHASVPENPRLAAAAIALKSVQPESIQRLVAGIVLPQADFDSVLHSAKILWSRQITFTRFVEGWRDVLQAASLDLNVLFAGLPLDEEQRLPVFIALRSSLSRLCRKWNLTDRYPSGSASLCELVELFAAGVLEPGDVWDVLSRGTITRRQTRVPSPEPQPWVATPSTLPDAVSRWLAGHEVDWQDCLPERYPKLSLPLYPFDRQVYWLQPEGDRSALAPRSVSQTFRSDDPVIAAHYLNGRLILPAASMVCFALDAVQQISGKAVHTLSDFAIHHGVSIPLDEAAGTIELSALVNLSEATVQLSVNGRTVGSAQITALTETDHDRPWMPQTWLREFDPASLYTLLRSRGYQYGTALQVMRSLAVNDTISECVIATDNQTALLDGILQAAVCLRSIWAPTEPSIFEVPSKMGTLMMRDIREVTGPVTVRIERQQCKFSASGSEMRVIALDRSGTWVAVVDRLESAIAPLMAPEIAYFELHWQPTPLIAGTNLAAPELALIMAGSVPLGLSLFQSLRSRSAECSLVLAGESFQALGGGMYQMDVTVAADYDRLLRTIAPALTYPSTATSVTVYWVTRPADPQSPLEATVADQVAQGVRGVFLLTQAWTKLYPAIPLRLVAITVDAQIVTLQDHALGFASAGIEALGRTVAIELPQCRFKSVDLDSALSVEERSRVLLAEAAAPFDQDAVAYRDGLRYTQQVRDLTERTGETFTIPTGAHILVTGGNGALAAEVVRAIAAQTSVHLILVGRSPANAHTERLMAEIADLGAISEYHQADVTDSAALDHLFVHWREMGIHLQGVIHTAGQLDDRLLHNQSADSFDRVVAPKLMAAVRLSERLRDHPVEFFVAFSSITALTGNAGQANYGVANALLDAFCAYRSRHAAGRSLAINWGLWQARGMGAAAPLADRFRSLGLEPLTAASGRFALMNLLTRACPYQIVVTGKGTAKDALTQSSIKTAPPLSDSVIEIVPPHTTPDRDRIEQDLVALVARTLKTAPETISRQEGFFSLGIESLMIEEMMAELSKRHTGLRPTLLFEYPNITVLATYLASHATATHHASESLPALDVPVAATITIIPTELEGKREERESRPLPTPALHSGSGYAIGIIGMDGRYPQSPDLDTYWQNLLSGRSCVEEIPTSRWDHTPYFAETRQPNRTYGKWGGFVAGVDRFDPLFFNISPKEAEQTDPQQRLFLESVWHTMEHAGYGSRQSRQSQRVGLFAGVMWHDYSHVARDLSLTSDQVSGNGSLFWAIANRVSHFLDFTGPSLAIDTACSSSLTAIHLACQSLLMGDCDMAVAGGVNLSLHPFRYLYLSQAGFLSKDGLCRSFGQGGDGYVPGEGVGAVLLKPLERALADGDTIHGVIRGSSINHGGRANGFTVPNIGSQSELIERALQRAGVRFCDIQYIECHGTGTVLGDSIEIGALWEVSKREGIAGDKIAIGSVKSNIGHLESAAGIAGVTKVLLSMRHGMIPATLHCQPPNPNIPFAETPFDVTAHNRAWPPGEQPRLACVSGFGAGGSNAHVVIEEWRTPVTSTRDVGPWIIVLSAKTPDRLVEMATNLRCFLQTQTPHLTDVAWTLQVGREPMPERLAILSHSLVELMVQLDIFVSGSLHPGCFRARASHTPSADPTSSNHHLSDLHLSDHHASNSRLSDEEIASHWVKGAKINWVVRRPVGSRRIPLPGYPFAQERYWLTPANQQPLRNPIQVVNAVNPVNAVSSVSDSRRLLTKVWIQDAGQTESPAGERLRVGVLFSGESGNDLYRHLSQFPGIECVALRDTGFPAWVTHLADLDAFVDVIDYEPALPQPVRPQARRFAIYQVLLDALAQRPLCLLQVTCRQHQTLSLGSAWLTSLLPVLSCEHRLVRAKAIAVTSDMTCQVIAAALQRELRLEDSHAEIRYQQGIRTVAAWQALPMPQSQLSLDATKVYIVTGGTSGLGALVATWLAAKGARKLLLLGVTALPPREQWASLNPSHSEAVQVRIRHVQALEQSGVQVRLFAGKLTERERLQHFFDSSTQELGSIGGVVHCAGVTPEGVGSFVRKSVDAILCTLEPKVQGLLTLAELVPPDQVDFFHLFSSVSAAVPVLGAGISDYACANGFLNAFAEVYRAAGSNVIAINWPNWSGAGSAQGESARYRQLGFKSLTVSEALTLYDSIASFPMPAVILPCTVDEQRFQVESLALALPPDPLHVPGESAPSVLPVPSVPTRSSVVSTPFMTSELSTQFGSFTPVPSVASDATQGAWNWLANWLSKELKIPRAQLNGTTNFAEYGVDSILLADLTQAIEKQVGSPIDPSQFLELSNIDSLSQHLGDRWSQAFGETPMLPFTPSTSSDTVAVPPPGVDERSPTLLIAPAPSLRAVAVIGLGCHFPGSSNVSAFWANLLAGVDSIREVPLSRWDHRLLYGQGEAGKLISKWGGFLDGIEMFDAAYFGIQDVEAEQVDPAIRQMLEVCAETVRHAGYEEAELRVQEIGVFVGARAGSYPQRYGNWAKNSIVGAGQNFIASLSSHVFDWKGPSLVIDSACSSSLVAVHLACKSLLDGECRMAIAAGVDLLLDEQPYRILSEAKALSPDGRCHTFDLQANGFVPGEGCGAVLLKHLDQALADGDQIYAVIEGSAINNDGRTMGTTTPSLEGQQRVIEAALNAAGVDGGSISYVEAHGTGTMIGDPIELKGLSQVIRKYTDDTGFCAIGSVKTNIGHLLSAAGIAGFIKTALAAWHGRIPPTLHCDQPNPRFDFANSPLFPCVREQRWQPRRDVRRAGISSFGFGGTNCHVILRAAQPQDGHRSRRSPLAPPEFQRKYAWIERKPSSAVVQSPVERRTALLEFEELVTR
ncbi:MAG: SDR family NAD(P)-dependent oxidoreductase [Nostoc sp.]|uniref:SDR family NAD(P)-dependent oxidoreductase n=1 Tax=Nostoc sp. TaxID=1180 RepID=UPI002FFB40CF